MTDAMDMELGEPVLDPSVLEGDGVPDENQSLTCFSCDEPMADLYCGNCGQKNDDYRRSLWKLGAEAFAALTAFENRIWRTWGNLLARPGRVPREYADGRRTHWSSPVRVYIFMSILLFGFMEVTGTYFFAVEFELEPKEGVTADASELTRDDVRTTWQLHAFPTDAQVESWNDDLDFRLLEDMFSETDVNSALSRYAAQGAGGVEDMLAALEEDAGDLSPEKRRERIAVLEQVREELLASATGASVEGPAAPGLERAAVEITEAIADQQALLARSEEYVAQLDNQPDNQSDNQASDPSDAQPDTGTGKEGEDNGESVYIGYNDDDDFIVNGTTASTTAVNRLLLDFIRRPAIGNDILNRWLPRIIFLMMPLTMLIAALFIRGDGKRHRRGPNKGELKRPGSRPALLYDHIVHAAYIHAVAYLFLLAGILAARVVPGGTVATVLTLALLIHLPLSLRRMFGRGLFKTIWTAYGVAFIYLLLVLILTTIAVVSGLAEEIAVRETLIG